MNKTKGLQKAVPYVFNVLAAAAAKDDNRDQNDNPAIIVAEERIKAAHLNASLHYLKIM